MDLAAARAQRAVALAGVRTAGQVPNPTASVSVVRDSPHESVFLDQPLEVSPKRRRRIELAKQEAALTDTDIGAAERQLRRRAREAYYALAFARGVTQAHAETVRLAERLHDIAQQRFQAGDIARIELIQAELELARAQADFQVAQQEETVALSQLNALLNEPSTTPWELTSALDAAPPSLALPELITRAAGSSTELARLQQESQIERRKRSLLQAERVPNLDVQFGADLNAPHDFRVGPRGQLAIELPIFSRNQGQIAESRATSEVLERQTAAAQRSVEAHVESAYYELLSRETQVTLYRDKLLPSARQLASMAEESYRAGKSNILTVVAAQQDVQQTNRAYLDSLLAMQNSFAQLEETVSAPLD